MNETESKNRTKVFALAVIELCESLPKKYAIFTASHKAAQRNLRNRKSKGA